jgi:hypothetical protein
MKLFVMRTPLSLGIVVLIPFQLSLTILWWTFGVSCNWFEGD